MAYCEDFPCCDHEAGCCPDFENGRQINMKCVCGATVPLGGPSCCESCLRDPDDFDDRDRYDDRDDDEENYDDDDIDPRYIDDDDYSQSEDEFPPDIPDGYDDDIEQW